MDKETQLYMLLATYGLQIPLTLSMADAKFIPEWTEEKFKYVQYNTKRPDIRREGLSITSLDGGLSGRPDLDSFYAEDPESMPTEMDINVPTPVYEHPEIKKLCEHWQPYVGRSHFLKIPPGGFFPPHRDFKSTDLHSFRIIVPMRNMEYPKFTFMLEDKILPWKNGSAYFLNTAKQHHLFNAGSEDAYMIVLNVGTNPKTVMTVIERMRAK